MRIVFMGTPEFAVSSLERLLTASFDLVGVVTNPDRPSGRGRKESPSPVKEKALEYGLPLLQPEDLRDTTFIEELRSWAPDLQVVVAFRLLPEEVWKIPPYGSINLHASLLPAYRGAAPIQRAIMNGEERTGVTTFFIEEGMDQGDVLLQEGTVIPEDMTAGELHDRLMKMGADLLVRTVKGIEEGSLRPTPQPDPGPGTPIRAPKLGREDRRFDPTLDAKEVHDRIRGMSPFPGVQCELVRAEGEP
ncbi:MAG: methionyl-tRNA formyltransferase, partial [Flavobacteriales bacterium]